MIQRRDLFFVLICLAFLTACSTGLITEEIQASVEAAAAATVAVQQTVDAEVRQSVDATLTAIAPSVAPAPTSIPAAPSIEPTPTSIPAAPSSTPTRAPATRRPTGPLDFDWVVESAGANPANPGEWLAIFVVRARGGDGRYAYFHDGLPVDGPRIRVVWRACRNKPGSIEVRDGTGQSVKEDYFYQSPYCDVTPPPPS
jgi:hypothetical protein